MVKSFGRDIEVTFFGCGGGGSLDQAGGTPVDPCQFYDVYAMTSRV